MSQTDPVADFLTMIRNAHMASHAELTTSASKMRLNIAKLMNEEGYIQNYKFDEKENNRYITVTLRYDNDNKPVIRHITKFSRPVLRVHLVA